MSCGIAAFYITPNGTQSVCKNFHEVSFDYIRNLVEIAMQKVLKTDKDALTRSALVNAFFHSKWLF